jgi:hypothetical protein
MHATYIDVIIALLYADYAAGVVKSGACLRTQWRHILHVTLPPLPRDKLLPPQPAAACAMCRLGALPPLRMWFFLSIALTYDPFCE